MARLGELLIAAGELTAAQIEQALRAQVMWGGRLGTNLVELGFIDLDKLATALARQYRMPAAYGRHFDRADPRVQNKLSPDIAERYSCIPLLFAGPDRSQLIVATIAPMDKKGIAIIADDLALEPKQIVQAIAGELRIRYHLERAYKIPRSSRFLRSRGKTIPPFPHFDIDPLAFEDSQVDTLIPPTTTMTPVATATIVEVAAEDSAGMDLAIEEARGELRARLETKAAEKEQAEKAQAEKAQVEKAARLRAQTAPPSAQFAPEEISELEALAFDGDEQVAIPEPVADEKSSGRERRRYVRTIDSPPPTESERERHASLGRISIRRMQVAAATVVEEEPTSAGMTLGEATRAIRRSQDRDRIAELVSETLFRFMLSCEAAQMLVIRGDAAMGWKGFARSGASVPELAVPLDQPGMIPRVIERCQTCRSPSSDLGPIDQLLLVSLGASTGDLAVVPVSIANQVMCVIAMATRPGASTATAESIAAAAGAAFARMMRNASR